jgi:hypothetical protein
MESSTMLGVKSTDNLWVYPLIGFDTYLMYERDKNIVSACDYHTGRVFNEKELSWIYRNMSFEDFVLYSQNCFLTNLKLN